MNFIKEISVARQSMYGNVVIAQTDDSKRVDELVAVMRAKGSKENMFIPSKKPCERWLLFDTWDGLFQHKFGSDPKTGNPVGKWEHITDAKKMGGESRYIIPNVSEELYKYKEVKEAFNVLVMKNIFETDKVLNRALRSWATSEVLRKQKATVVVFVEDKSIFPMSVWSKAKIVDIPKALEDEREKMIKDLVKVMAAPVLPDSDLRAAVRICAGMNKDQIDSAVIESIIRKERVDLDSLAFSKGEMIGKDPVLEIIQRPRFGFKSIGGYDILKALLFNRIVLPLRHPDVARKYGIRTPRGFIFYGPPGTGKTLIMKGVSKELNMSLLFFRPSNVLDRYVGGTEQKTNRAWKIADSMAPCMVGTDEVDRLGKRNAGGGDAGSQVHKELFSNILEKLGDKNRRWIFIGTTNKIMDMDEAMLRAGRINSIIPMPYPNRNARVEIFRIHASVENELVLDDDVDYDALAGMTYMYSGSDIEEVVLRTAQYVFEDEIKSKNAGRRVSMGDFEHVLRNYRVDVKANERYQAEVKTNCMNLTNDETLLSVFEDEAQVVSEASRDEIAREMLKARKGNGKLDVNINE